VAFLILLLCSGQSSGRAETKPLELRWAELAPLIQGRRVQLILPEGTSLEGQAVVVRDDALVMDVGKFSGSKSYRKGSAAVPRESVTLIKVRGTRGSWGKNLGSVIGVIAGVVVGTYVAATVSSSAATGIPLFLGIAGGLTVGGYHTGREIDRRDMLIRIVQ
jgi:hypothetical protein